MSWRLETAADALWTLTLWIVVTVLIQRPDQARRFATRAVLGAASAVAVERVALVAGRWSYNRLMPVLPVLAIGVCPCCR